MPRRSMLLRYPPPPRIRSGANASLLSACAVCSPQGGSGEFEGAPRHQCHSGGSRNTATTDFVIATDGVYWIPAFAGMTR